MRYGATATFLFTSLLVFVTYTNFLYEPTHQPGNFNYIKPVRNTDIVYQALKRTVPTSFLLKNSTNKMHDSRLHLLILLMLSGQIELNPGPNDLSDTSVYPCGICENPVIWNERAISCDRCNILHHANCMAMNENVYEAIANHSNVSWLCCKCGFPNFASSLFDANQSIFSENQFSSLTSDESQATPVSSPIKTPFNPLASSTPTTTRSTPKSKPRNVRKLKINVLNCNSIQSVEKRSRLNLLIENTNPDIFIGTESKLGPEHQTSEIFNKNYTTFRKDREKDGGGVFIMVKSDITVTPIPEADTNCEILWCKIQSPGNKTQLIGSFYKPPDADDNALIELDLSLQKIRKKYPSANIYLGGDFNLGDIDWMEQKVNPGHNSRSQCEKLIDTANDFGLQQMIDEPTFRNKSKLDLFFTSTPNLVMKTYTAPGISKNDHDLVVIESMLKVMYNKKAPRQVSLFSKANVTQIKKDVQEFNRKFFVSEPEKRSVNENWNMIKNALNDTVSHNVPQKRISPRWNQPWISKSLKRGSRKKQRLFSKAKGSGSHKDWNEYRQFRNKLQNEVKKKYWEYVNETIDPDNDKNGKKFWKFIKSQKQDNTGVVPLKSNAGLMTSPTDKANALNDQFQRAFTPQDATPPPDLGKSPYPDMKNIIVTEEGVHKLLAKIDVSKATGPDGISGRILKLVAEDISPSITFLFQQAIVTGENPNDWKEANIVPIFKKGDRTLPINYRPVSLTSILCKTLEHIMASNIMDHLDECNILVDIQHAFRQSRSCETQLLQTVNDFALGLNEGGQTDVAVLDFSKAFDKVDHNLLLMKLDFYGIRGSYLDWMRSFLTNRTQKVVVDGFSSDTIDVTSGVPQGTVLGPILFIMFINDISQNVQSQVRLFADDCIIYRPIKNEKDCEAFQQDLKELEKWADKWKMQFNIKKCFVMNITLQKTRLTKFQYYMKGELLQLTDATVYLGITISANLSWNKHIDTMTSKANRVLNFLKRNLKKCPKQIKEKAYTTYVRPITEYASTVWDNNAKGNIDKIEKVQRRAARFVTGNYERQASVTNMIQTLGWPTLQQRRHFTSLVMFYKVSHQLVAIPVTMLPPMLRDSTGHMSRYHHNLAYLIPYGRIDSYRQSFVPRTVLLWNYLPCHVVNATTCDTFKVQLASFYYPASPTAVQI